MAKGPLYITAVNAAGCGVFLLAISLGLRTSVPTIAMVLVALALMGGMSVLRLKSVAASFSLGDAFTLSALFLYGPDLATVTAAVDALAIALRIGGTPRRILFNVSAPTLAVWAAGTIVFRAMGMPLPVHAPDATALVVSVSATVLLVFLFGSGFVAGAVALHEGSSVLTVWRRHFAGLWVAPMITGYFAALVALFTRQMGVTALVALLPIPLIVHQMFRTSFGRVEDQLLHLGEMNRVYQSTIEAFATAVDAKDAITHGHVRRVQLCAIELARELGVADTDTLRALEAAALLHDVGKIATPEHILNKPGKLTPAEFEEMKKHVTIGAEILSAAQFPFPVVPIVRCHHESWDGSGYPNGVKAWDIPIGARILMVVDCFDALTSDRPYRAAMTEDEAFAILRERRGTMYDPHIVDAFMQIYPRLQSMIAKHNEATAQVPPRAA